MRGASRAVIAALIRFVPDLHEIDGYGLVAQGEWNGGGGADPAWWWFLIALGVAALLGGWGVHTRRLE